MLDERFAQVHVGSLADRCRAIAAIGHLGAEAAPAVPRLIELFDSTEIEGPGSSGFGPTGYDPGRDFLIALAAVDALVAIGEPAIEPTMAIVRRAGWVPRRYYAMLVVGRLRVAAAAPLLEAAIAAQESVSERCNFDQCNDYPLYEAALAALLELDEAHAWAALDRAVRSKSHGRHWALLTLAKAPGATEVVGRLLADGVLSASEQALVASRA